MSDELQDLKGDLAFLRALTDEGGRGTARDAVMLIAVGITFGLVNFLYWLIFRGLLHLSGAWQHAPWIAGVVVLLVTFVLMQRRLPHATSAASRGMCAAWLACGIGISVAAVALGIGAHQINVPHLVLWVFPIVLLTLYGSAWGVAFAVRRRTWFAAIGAGCLLGALLCGVFMGSANEWLVLSFGLFLLVAAPGLVLLRNSHHD